MRYCLALLLVLSASGQIQPPEEIGSLPGANRLPRRETTPPVEVTGLLRRLEAKSAVIEPDDARLITVYFDAKTKVPTLTPGDTVAVVAQVKDGRWTAVELRLVEHGTDKSKERARAELPVNVFEEGAKREATTEAVNRPVPIEPLPDPDPDGRPRIRRGRPAGIAEAASAPEPESTAPKPAAPVKLLPGAPDPLIAKAREVSASYSATLPNFIAQQITTRYERQPRGDFQVQDQVECEVIVENGLERYRAFKRHGRELKGPPNENGAWSSGEFRTMQEMVLGNTGAVFFNRAKDTIDRRAAVRFQFTVPRQSSQWRVETGSQVYLPAYSGTIWLDSETLNVLRIEIESRGIPEGFPVAKAETTIDYAFIRLGGREHLLPATAAMLTCEAGTRVCAKNEIQFRHYKAFGAESKITFEEK